MATRKVTRSSPSGPRINSKGTVTFDPTSCGSAAVTLQSVTLPEVKSGDLIMMAPQADIANIAIGIGYCLVTGTAKVPFINPTAGAIDPASQAFDWVIIRR